MRKGSKGLEKRDRVIYSSLSRCVNNEGLAEIVGNIIADIALFCSDTLTTTLTLAALCMGVPEVLM